MAVYVDSMRPAVRSSVWPYPTACHLMADGELELLEMAERIGLRRHWLQRGTLLHYDLTEHKRREAVLAGAIELTNRQVVDRIKASRRAR